MKDKLKLCWQLFLTFFKIGGFTFGGGHAMIPLIQKEAVETKGWVTDDDILEIIAIAESTPGPVAINSATFVGYRTAGFWGAVCATFGVVLPSFVIILAIAYLLNNFMELKPVKYAFQGINTGVLALLFKALWNMYKKSPKGWAAYVVMGGSFLLTAVLKLNMFLVIVLCAVFGLVTASLAERRMQK
jgi:chromate transporter